MYKAVLQKMIVALQEVEVCQATQQTQGPLQHSCLGNSSGIIGKSGVYRAEGLQGPGLQGPPSKAPGPIEPKQQPPIIVAVHLTDQHPCAKEWHKYSGILNEVRLWLPLRVSLRLEHDWVADAAAGVSRVRSYLSF